MKESRTNKKYSLNRVEKETKIKKVFIEAIENEEWDKLPEYPVVQGFVRSLSKNFGLPEERAAAILRRDYPPKTLPVNPKPDISNRFIWSPRVTFLIGVLLVTFLILGYLGFQYTRFVSPPKLSLVNPSEGLVATESAVLVTGQTDPDATITVNNQPVEVDENGNFVVEIEISNETSEIKVIAKSRGGKETVETRFINVQL